MTHLVKGCAEYPGTDGSRCAAAVPGSLFVRRKGAWHPRGKGACGTGFGFAFEETDTPLRSVHLIVAVVEKSRQLIATGGKKILVFLFPFFDYQDALPEILR